MFQVLRKKYLLIDANPGIEAENDPPVLQQVFNVLGASEEVSPDANPDIEAEDDPTVL